MVREVLTGVRHFALVVAVLAVGAAIFSTSAFASGATYSQTQTLPVPPASSFQASAGGDGWSVALSHDKVYNVFHHNNVMTVQCHLQANAAPCWPGPITVRDSANRDFWTSGHPGMYYDEGNDNLYIYGTSTANSSAGVVCFDTTHATTAPFCGYTQLTGAGEAWMPGWSAVSSPMQVGTKLYAFNYVGGWGVAGARNKMMCFDLSTHAACAGQPYSVAVGTGSMNGFLPSPSTAAIGDKLILPEYNNSLGYGITCFDTNTDSTCAGSWPVATPFSYAGNNGAPYPKLDAAGAVQGFCVPTWADQCYTMTGASTPTPAGMAGTIGNTTAWNGPSAVIGPRVYVADGNRNNQVECWDYSTGHSCPNFPKAFAGLGYIYTVTNDPQRPACLWVNADNGGSQIQSFDAYTGGACGQGAIRVLAQQFVVPQQDCFPTAYQSLQIIAPAPGSYVSGSVEFDTAGGNPLGIPNMPLDATGSVDLSGLTLNGATGLPQFQIALVGAPANLGQVTVKLTWTADYDPACVAPGAEVVKTATTLTTSLSGGGQSGDHITVLEGAGANDTATIAGDNAGAASGTIRYAWYSDSLCSTLALDGGDIPIATPGTLPASSVVSLPPGTYYVIASYSGDAGNLASQTACGDEVLKVRPLDDTPPVISPVVTGTLGLNGWYTSDVTVQWLVTDPESAISGTSGCDDSLVSVDTAGITFTCTATSAGGTASESVTLKRDATAPSIVATDSPAPNGAGWNNSSPDLVFTCTDNLSGIASCTPGHAVGEGAGQTFTGVATDQAGNTASVDSRTFNVDLTAPTLNPSVLANILQGSSASASAGAADALSGIASASCTPVDTSTLGPKTGTCTATDRAGNTTTAGFSYLVYALAPGGGAFVIGDKSTTGTVTFWGSQWAKTNSLTGGAASSSFKGYAKSPAAPACGTGWSTDPGNSSPPPAGPLPEYMAVIVTSASTKSGSQISGNTVHVVVVKTSSGYDSNPGHAGTGTVVATIC